MAEIRATKKALEDHFLKEVLVHELPSDTFADEDDSISFLSEEDQKTLQEKAE